MKIAKVFAFVTMLLVLTSTNGQPPSNCRCGDLNDFSVSCNTAGCSAGDNPTCGDRNQYAFHAGPLPSRNARGRVFYKACSCPGYSYGGRPTNGFYDASSVYYGFLYNFTDCTSFGNIPRLRDGSPTLYINDAIKCCDFCCRSSTSTANTVDSLTAITPSATSVTQTFTIGNTTTRADTEIYLLLLWIGENLTLFPSPFLKMINKIVAALLP